MNDLINNTLNNEIFTVIDLRDAFYSIKIKESDRFKTAFEFEGYTYEWNSMPMGFKNSPLVMQRVMNKLLKELIHKGVEVYLDDIISYSKEKKGHKELINKVLGILAKNNMVINEKKIQFMSNTVKLLGIEINGKEKLANALNGKELIEYKKPTSLKN